MTLTIHTPNTLLLGVYTRSGLSVALGNLRCADGEMLEAIDDADPNPWALLDRALTEAKTMQPDNLIVFSNDSDLIAFGTPPLQIPQTDGVTEKMFFVQKGERGHYEHIPSGGDPHQWSIARLICAYRCWHFQHTDKLPKAEERWQQHQPQSTAKPQSSAPKPQP